MYGLIFNKELASELNDNLFESLRAGEVMKYKAEHDALTGVLNRSGFDNVTYLLENEQFPLAFALVDLLNGSNCLPGMETAMEHLEAVCQRAVSFKSVNDTYGHEIGDKILFKTSKILSSSFRSSDIVSRIGGDEFAIILNNLTYDKKDFITRKSKQINDRLKNPIDKLPPVSLSVGVAFSTHGYSKELFHHADCALYETKRNGKSGCSFYEPQMDKHAR